MLLICAQTSRGGTVVDRTFAINVKVAHTSYYRITLNLPHLFVMRNSTYCMSIIDFGYICTEKWFYKVINFKNRYHTNKTSILKPSIWQHSPPLDLSYQGSSPRIAIFLGLQKGVFYCACADVQFPRCIFKVLVPLIMTQYTKIWHSTCFVAIFESDGQK